MKPACGPPNAIGTPNRCDEPNTTSAPISPGGFSSTSARMSAPTQAIAPRSCASAISPRRSAIRPEAPGYCASTPKQSPSGRPSDRSATTTSMPSGSARVSITPIVCGNASASTMKRFEAAFEARRATVIASAAAVASSSSDAFATGRPVRSEIIVWKFRRASRRPCEISG